MGLFNKHSSKPAPAANNDPAQITPNTEALATVVRLDNAINEQDAKTQVDVPASKTSSTAAPAVPPAGLGPTVIVTRPRFWIIFTSMCLTIFLYSLDQLIIACAIPPILAEFGALTQISWLANGFFVTMLAFSMAYSQFLLILPGKAVLILAVLLFELGSLICAVAPGMTVLILGRAVSGVGASGIMGSCLIILSQLTGLRERAKYMGLIGVCFAFASVLGPLVGGAFADGPGWRWCFWINLPIGGLAVLALVLCLPKNSPPMGAKPGEYKGYGWHMIPQMLKCDWVGVAIVLAFGICLILGFEWGGATKPWSDGSVIACLVMIPVTAIIFILWEWYLGPEKAMMPLDLFKERNLSLAAVVTAAGFGSMMILLIYLPTGYQALYHTTATGAGIRLLPLIMTQIVLLIASGRLVVKTGQVKPFLAIGPAFVAIGGGLLYSTKWNTSGAHIMGYQAIVGVGIGMFLQNSMTAVQWTFASNPRLISKATNVGMFIGMIGRIAAISIGGTVFSNVLRRELKRHADQINPQVIEIVVGDPTGVWGSNVPESARTIVLQAYSKSLSSAYVIAVPLGILAFIAAMFMSTVAPPHAAPTAEAITKPKDLEEGSDSDHEDALPKVLTQETKADHEPVHSPSEK